MNIAAIWVGKLSGNVLRLIGRRGNALPGLIVERVFAGFLADALSGLPAGVVIVSGTNGKTTTTKMVATILAQQSRVLTNDTGSNFVRGAITATCEQASWSGRLNADVAVFELDEAHAVRFVEVVRPQRVLLLNVMRDQLDRFGEIDTTAQLLRTVARTAQTALVLNADDPRVAAIADVGGGDVSYFGVAPELRADFPTDDEMYSPSVAAAGPQPRLRAELIQMQLGETTRAQLRIGDSVHDVTLRAGGAHNAQNATAAAALALTFGLAPDVIAQGLREVEPAFGRGQTFAVRERRLVLHLVKNPAGFRQTLRTLSVYAPSAVVIAINDDYADSRDVSWLWDVQFAEPLAGVLAGGSLLLTSGTRAVDMALRLRYDGVETDGIEPDLRAAVVQALDRIPAGQTVVVLSTYTAMWALYSVLLGMGQSVSAPENSIPSVGASVGDQDQTAELASATQAAQDRSDRRADGAPVQDDAVDDPAGTAQS